MPASSSHKFLGNSMDKTPHSLLKNLRMLQSSAISSLSDVKARRPYGTQTEKNFSVNMLDADPREAEMHMKGMTE